MTTRPKDATDRSKENNYTAKLDPETPEYKIHKLSTLLHVKDLHGNRILDSWNHEFITSLSTRILRDNFSLSDKQLYYLNKAYNYHLTEGDFDE